MAAAISDITIIFDSNVTKVVWSDFGGEHIVETSGTEVETSEMGNGPFVFTVTLKEGYVISNVVFENYGEYYGGLDEFTDTTFTIFTGAAGYGGVVTITSKKVTGIITDTLTQEEKDTFISDIEKYHSGYSDIIENHNKFMSSISNAGSLFNIDTVIEHYFNESMWIKNPFSYHFNNNSSHFLLSNLKNALFQTRKLFIEEGESKEIDTTIIRSTTIILPTKTEPNIMRFGVGKHRFKILFSNEEYSNFGYQYEFDVIKNEDNALLISNLALSTVGPYSQPVMIRNFRYEMTYDEIFTTCTVNYSYSVSIVNQNYSVWATDLVVGGNDSILLPFPIPVPYSADDKNQISEWSKDKQFLYECIPLEGDGEDTRYSTLVKEQSINVRSYGKKLIKIVNNLDNNIQYEVVNKDEILVSDIPIIEKEGYQFNGYKETEDILSYEPNSFMKTLNAIYETTTTKITAIKLNNKILNKVNGKTLRYLNANGKVYELLQPTKYNVRIYGDNQGTGSDCQYSVDNGITWIPVFEMFVHGTFDFTIQTNVIKFRYEKWQGELGKAIIKFNGETLINVSTTGCGEFLTDNIEVTQDSTAEILNNYY